MARTLFILSQRTLVALFTLMSLASTGHAQEADWSGQWDSLWRDGRARLMLTQDGRDVTGFYVPRNGQIEGHLNESGRIFEGRFSEDGRSGTFTFNLAPDGDSFMGRFDSGEWWNGGRLSASPNIEPWIPDLSSPREAMRSFLVSFNEIRYGGLDFVEPGLNSIVFESWLRLSAADRFELGKTLFEVVDLCVTALWDLPDTARIGNDLDYHVVLDQLGTPLAHNQLFRKGTDGDWRLLVPSEQELERLLARLREARGITTPDPDAHFELRTPRDTIRTFIEQVKLWDEGGREHVLGTLDLSALDPAVRDTEAPLLAEYLQQVLDRAGFLIWQELPNDPESRRPYVHFQHPLGAVVVAPYEEAEFAPELDAEDQEGTERGRMQTHHRVRWRFTAETLRDIRVLYDAFEDMPVAEGLREIEDRSTYFQLRSWFRANSPSMVARIGSLERWQLLCLIVLLFLGLLYGRIAFYAPTYLTRKKSEAVRAHWRSLSVRFVLPFVLLTLGLGLHELFELLGIPPKVLWILSALSWVAAAFGGTWLAFSVIHSVGQRLFAIAERTETPLDEILISLSVSLLKISTILVGLFVAADVLGVPYRTVFAGLGIGGFAFAIAAQDTLSNFFGSAVLLADRPFRRGDLISVGEHRGFVEHLGLRSTRIRTFDDSVVIIPNRELAREAIDNRSQRRTRTVEFTLGATYDTTPEQLDRFCNTLRAHYQTADDVSEEEMFVGIEALSASSIDLCVSLRIEATSFDEEVVTRHTILMDALRLAAEHGVELAFPTQTVHIGDSAQPYNAPISEEE